MIWLLSWLFPLWALLPRARKLGAVSFTEVAGVGWQCSIRPNHDGQSWARRGLNSWTGQGSSLAASLRRALSTAHIAGQQERGGAPCVPKLGGAEFDDE